ncbi:hypothetical protein [Roseimicrobium sp. ORNL1]|uniref:hypothetical protein n=1 Tax=Roseimicrobium sp. ORNL1 TaxID=2711231 RepID=UPI00197D0A1A|nr:hypothetical protein [Roseimicrobium sp. ORNL1]
MQIIGIENMTGQELANELDRGGRFVIFKYTLSVIVMTFNRGSDIYFVRGGEGTFGKGAKYTLLTMLCGWWGIPWGPIFSIGSLFTNLTGGKDVTHEVLAVLQAPSHQSYGVPPPVPGAIMPPPVPRQ